ncbi:unnamed protein product [Gordionus sp. m RMFG-2023]
MRYILFLCIIVYVKANSTVITTELSHLCLEQHFDDFPNLFSIYEPIRVLQFAKMYLRKENNNSIFAYIQGGDRNIVTNSTDNITDKSLMIFEVFQLLNLMRLKEFNLRLNIEADVEIGLNHTGSTFGICMLPLNNVISYMCLEFMNANLTIRITNHGPNKRFINNLGHAYKTSS